MGKAPDVYYGPKDQCDFCGSAFRFSQVIRQTGALVFCGPSDGLVTNRIDCYAYHKEIHEILGEGQAMYFREAPDQLFLGKPEPELDIDPYVGMNRFQRFMYRVLSLGKAS